MPFSLTPDLPGRQHREGRWKHKGYPHTLAVETKSDHVYWFISINRHGKVQENWPVPPGVHLIEVLRSCLLFCCLFFVFLNHSWVTGKNQPTNQTKNSYAHKMTQIILYIGKGETCLFVYVFICLLIYLLYFEHSMTLKISFAQHIKQSIY